MILLKHGAWVCIFEVNKQKSCNNNCPESLQHPVKTKCKWSRRVYFVLASALIYSIWYGVQSESKAPAQVQLPRPTKLWNSEFDGVWVLYTNFGYLRNVNAGLRRVESSLRARRHISKRRLCEHLRKVFDRMCRSQPLAAQPTQSWLRLKSASAYAKSLRRIRSLHRTAKHTWSAYATYHATRFYLNFII